MINLYFAIIFLWVGAFSLTAAASGTSMINATLSVSTMDLLSTFYHHFGGRNWTWQSNTANYGVVWNFSRTVVNNSSSTKYEYMHNPCSANQPWQGILCVCNHTLNLNKHDYPQILYDDYEFINSDAALYSSSSSKDVTCRYIIYI